MTEYKKHPRLFIFAGANGSGKTTMAEEILPYAKIKEFVNADEIARGLSPLNPSGQAATAGRLVLKRMDDLISKKEDFAIESTLSGKTLLQKIKQAKKEDYVVRLFYVYTDDIKINISRIKSRVKQGGHSVPTKDVKRRYARSLQNLFTIYASICDIVSIYDNTSERLEYIAGKLMGDDKKFYVLKNHQEIFKKILKKAKVVR